MKAILLKLGTREYQALSVELKENQYEFTCLARSGGFLQSGATTLAIITEEERVDLALQLIRNVVDTHGKEPDSGVLILELDRYLRF